MTDETVVYSLTGRLADLVLDWLAEDHSREDCYDEVVSYALATFVDGTAITPRGYDDTEMFAVHEHVATDGGMTPEADQSARATTTDSADTSTVESDHASAPQPIADTSDSAGTSPGAADTNGGDRA